MEKIQTESTKAEYQIQQHIEVLGSVGEVRKRDGEIFWFMNGTEKAAHETEPVWPIIASEIKRVQQNGQLGNVDHIRISPAVALHLIFEGVLDFAYLQTPNETSTEMTIDPSLFNSAEDVFVPFIVEKNMLQNRGGIDILIVDNHDTRL